MATYYGNTLVEQPCNWTWNKDGLTVNREWHGTAVDCFAFRAASCSIGSSMNDLGSGTGSYVITIAEAKVLVEMGGTGKLSVTINPGTNQSDGGTSNPTADYETDWTRVDKALREHPIYNIISGSTGPITGSKYLSASQWDLIDEWEATTDANEKSAYYASGSANMQHYMTRAQRQQDQFAVYIPVVKATRNYSIKPSSSGAGKIEQPPVAASAPLSSSNGKPYTYVKTADRLVKQSTGWQRSEEWTGFDSVDTDIINGI